MYSRIMVPMDGSELAECVIPHVQAIAGGCHVTDILLVQVVQPVSMPSMGEVIPGKLDAANKVSAREYLDSLASRLELAPAKLRTQVLFDARVAESLADYAVDQEVDIIILATHGRSGVNRWAYGSVADRIMRSTCLPVLMVRAPHCVPGI